MRAPEERKPEGQAGAPAITQVTAISATSHSWQIMWDDESREPSQVICLGIDRADSSVCPMVLNADGRIVSAYSIDPAFSMVMMSA